MSCKDGTCLTTMGSVHDRDCPRMTGRGWLETVDPQPVSETIRKLMSGMAREEQAILWLEIVGQKWDGPDESIPYGGPEARLQEAVNAECSCGGNGPHDGACPACMVFHRFMGRV